MYRLAYPHRLVSLLAALVASAPSLARAADNVNGNLLLFNNDGMWSWYMDERAIVDPTNGTILVSSVTSSPVAYPVGRPAGRGLAHREPGCASTAGMIGLPHGC